jgi:choline dehydrogenase
LSAGLYDYIIVGPGPAGCVLANRLTEDEDVSVLLLEAGGSDQKLVVQMPAAVPFAYMRKDLGLGYQAGPEPHLGGRYTDEKRGRVLGGSSSINAMIFNRGNPRDFDGWGEMGLPGWSWRRCLPCFERMETFADAPSEWRGSSGPLRVSRCKADLPIYDDFLRAGEQAGFFVTPDHNGRMQEGLHIAQAYIGNGVRSSSASSAYLAYPAAREPSRPSKHPCRPRADGRRARHRRRGQRPGGQGGAHSVWPRGDPRRRHIRFPPVADAVGRGRSGCSEAARHPSAASAAGRR